jgi:hypothetical protein
MATQGSTTPRCVVCWIALPVDDAPYNACAPCLVREPDEDRRGYPFGPEDDTDPPDPFEEDGESP